MYYRHEATKHLFSFTSIINTCIVLSVLHLSSLTFSHSFLYSVNRFCPLLPCDLATAVVFPIWMVPIAPTILFTT